MEGLRLQEGQRVSFFFSAGVLYNSTPGWHEPRRSAQLFLCLSRMTAALFLFSKLLCQFSMHVVTNPALIRLPSCSVEMMIAYGRAVMCCQHRLLAPCWQWSDIAWDNGVTVKWSDSVETRVVLKSNNCRGQERASEGSRAPRGHVGRECWAVQLQMTWKSIFSHHFCDLYCFLSIASIRLLIETHFWLRINSSEHDPVQPPAFPAPVQLPRTHIPCLTPNTPIIPCNIPKSSWDI